MWDSLDLPWQCCLVEHVLHTDERPQWVLDAWATVVPRGVWLGHVLFESGELRRLRDKAVHVSSVIERLTNNLA